MLYNEITCGTDSRAFVVGDIHGCYDVLMRELDNVEFDFNSDLLFSVGDLVDRGPKSVECAELVLESWFYAIRGNHEVMCLPRTAGSSWHCMNGGSWWHETDNTKRVKLAHALNNLPYLMTVTTPSGRRVGLAHASFPALKRDSEMYLTDWNDAQELVTIYETYDENPIVWDRDQIYRAKKILSLPEEYRTERKLREFNVANIDHVYFGHTPLKEPLTLGNCTWLDTGAFAGGPLTVLELK